MTKDDFLENWETIKNYIKRDDAQLFQELNKTPFNQYTPKEEIIEIIEDTVATLNKEQAPLRKLLLLTLADARKL